jgi:gas vesicle protein
MQFYPVGGIISMAAALYIDTQVAKHTPEELAKKATDAKKTSAAFYKAHGLLTKAGNTKIDDKTQREISDKIDKSAPRK